MGVTDIVLTDEVRDLAGELLPEAAAMGRGMNDHLLAGMPELQAADEELKAETAASCEANVTQVLRLLRAGADVESAVLQVQAADLVRGVVRRGIELPVLLRSYRLGHEWFWDEYARALRERIPDGDRLALALQHASAFCFAYTDRISGLVVETYGVEHGRLAGTAEQWRIQTVRALLSGSLVDEEVASRRLGYELRRHHIVLHVSADSPSVRGLERAVDEAVAAAGLSEPFVVASGIASFDVWASAFTAPALDGLRAYEPPAGVSVAVGGPAHGLAGFRAAHDQAQQAARVMGLSSVLGPVATYAELEVVCLLANDLPRARAFVAGKLGPLAADDPSMARLRETLLALLSSGGSRASAASDMHVHQNTISYRVKRAEELLGRAITDDVLGILAALTLVSVIGAEDRPAPAR